MQQLNLLIEQFRLNNKFWIFFWIIPYKVGNWSNRCTLHNHLFNSQPFISATCLYNWINGKYGQVKLENCCHLLCCYQKRRKSSYLSLSSKSFNSKNAIRSLFCYFPLSSTPGTYSKIVNLMTVAVNW